MDAPLDNDKADRRLRALFQEAGPLVAPPGMEARVLQHIALLPQRPSVVPTPLLPKWVWFVAAGTVLTLIFFLVTSPTGASGSSDALPRFELAEWLSSKWVLAAMLCLALLATVDQFLVRVRFRERA